MSASEGTEKRSLLMRSISRISAEVTIFMSRLFSFQLLDISFRLFSFQLLDISQALQLSAVRYQLKLLCAEKAGVRAKKLGRQPERQSRERESVIPTAELRRLAQAIRRNELACAFLASSYPTAWQGFSVALGIHCSKTLFP